MMCGGTTEAKPADSEVQILIKEVKEAVENKAGKKFEVYNAVEYKTQVVAGTNYFVKIDVGDEHIHVRIFKPLPHTGNPSEVTDVQLNKTQSDPIEYF